VTYGARTLRQVERTVRVAAVAMASHTFSVVPVRLNLRKFAREGMHLHGHLNAITDSGLGFGDDLA
jgi:hypothetical protein